MRIVFVVTDGKLSYHGDKPKDDAEAFDISIAKWQTIKDFALLKDGGTSTCGLCLRYYRKHCVGCPVFISTGADTCDGNRPYIDHHLACVNDDVDGQIAAAAREVRFLKRLKRKYVTEESA